MKKLLELNATPVLPENKWATDRRVQDLAAEAVKSPKLTPDQRNAVRLGESMNLRPGRLVELAVSKEPKEDLKSMFRDPYATMPADARPRGAKEIGLMRHARTELRLPYEVALQYARSPARARDLMEEAINLNLRREDAGYFAHSLYPAQQQEVRRIVKDKFHPKGTVFFLRFLTGDAMSVEKNSVAVALGATTNPKNLPTWHSRIGPCLGDAPRDAKNYKLPTRPPSGQGKFTGRRTVEKAASM